MASDRLAAPAIGRRTLGERRGDAATPPGRTRWTRFGTAASIAVLHERHRAAHPVHARPTLRYRTQTNAEVEDCVRGPANTYHDAATGRLRAPRGYRNDAPTEDRLLTTLQRRGDRWYVVAATGRGDVTC